MFVPGEGTLSTDVSTDTSAADSSTVDLYRAGDLISTVDRIRSESTSTGTKPEVSTDEAGKTEAASEPKVKTDEVKTTQEPVKEPPFHEHPRWQEMMTKNRQLEAEIYELKQANQPKAEDKPDYKDLTGMTVEEVLAWQAEDPIGFAANQARQIVAEVLKKVDSVMDMRGQQSKTDQAFAAFAKENPEFTSLWQSGELQRRMDANPLHNPVSAYLEIQAEKSKAGYETALQEAKAQAAKEAEEKARRNYQTKQQAAVLSGAPRAHPAHAQDPALTNPEQYGGINAAIASRLRAMRAKV